MRHRVGTNAHCNVLEILDKSITRSFPTKKNENGHNKRTTNLTTLAAWFGGSYSGEMWCRSSLLAANNIMESTLIADN